MASGWQSALEGIIAFKKVREDNEDFLALIWCAGVGCVLSEVGRPGSGEQSLSFRNETRGTHITCPPEVEGVLIQEFGCGCNLLSVRTRYSVRRLLILLL